MKQRILAVMCCVLLAASAALGAAAASENILPEGDFENAARVLPEFWHRMGDYTATARGAWRIDTAAARSGKASAAGTSAAEYLMQAEVSPAGPWVVEGFLKAERDGAQCQVRLGWYSNWSLANERKTIQVGRDWTRFTIEATLDGGKIGGRGTVVEVGVLPKTAGRFWLDDITLRRKSGEANTPRTRAVHQQPRAPAAPPVTPEGQGRTGEVKLRFLDVPVFAVPFPVRVAVPLPQGDLYQPRRVRVVAADGRTLKAQARVLSRWLADGSVQSLLLTFALPANAKRPPVVKYGPDIPEEDAATESRIRPRMLTAEEAGIRFFPHVILPLGRGSAQSSAAELGYYVEGNIDKALRARWTLSRDERHVGSCELWCTVYPEQERADFEFVFVSDGEAFVQDLESISLKWPFKPRRAVARCLVGLADGRTARTDPNVTVLQTAINGAFEYNVFSNKPGKPVKGKAAGWIILQRETSADALIVKDFWWKHPKAIRVTPEGLQLDLWPREVRDLRLSRGVAMSMKFTWVHGDSAQELIPLCKALSQDPEPLVVADVEAYCRSGIFGVALTPDKSPFPIFEKTLAGMSPLTHWAFSKYSRKSKLRLGFHGVFDYGDGPGDGGWGNAETMLEHAFYQWFFRTGGREQFDMAQALARHFRDVDIEHPYGEIHCHCMNHTLSGAVPSHSWIQGMRDDYLLTGNLRTLQVLHECGRWLCSLSPEKMTGRGMTRLFDNIVDLYLFSGDPQFRDKALEYARVIGKRQDPARVLSGGAAKSWFEHRYTAGTAFVWYGTYALAKLHHAAPTDEIKRIFLTELDISLNTTDRMPFMYKRYPEKKGLYPEHPGPAFQAQEIGRWAMGRGSVIWPSLAYAYRITGDKKYLDIGFRSFGYYALSMTPDTAIFTTPFIEVLKENGYGAEQEKALLAQIAVELAAKYPKALPDAGFDTESLKGWSRPNRKGRIESVRDTQVKLAGASSLRMTSFTVHSKPYSTATFYCETPGRYRVRVWARAEKGVRGGLAVNYKRFLPPSGRSYYAGLGDRHPKNPEWRAFEAIVDVPAAGTLQVLVYNIKSVGSIWYDEVQIERIGEAPAGPPKALLNPGFEQETLMGWSRAAAWMGDYYPDATRAAVGRQSLRIDGRNRRNGYVAQQVQLEPNRQYRLTVCVAAAEPGVPAVMISAPALLVTAAPVRTKRLVPAGWTLHAATFRSPPDGLVTIKLHNTAGEGTVWFDDVRLG